MASINQDSSVHSGRLIHHLALYDQKCVLLLQKAYEKAKEQEDLAERQRQIEYGDNTVPVLPSTTPQNEDASESSDDEDFPPLGSSDDASDDESTHSESSSVRSDPRGGTSQLATVAEAGEEEPLDTTERVPPLAEAFTKLSTTNRKKKQPSNKQQKRQAQFIKQHLSNIARTRFPLPPQEALIDLIKGTDVREEYQLCTPSSLLSGTLMKTATLAAQANSLMTLSQTLHAKRGYVVVLLLQSGRFAGGVFEWGNCLIHRALQHYTVRKGQGKAQSSQDQQRRPKSVGSQLRRSGEQALKEDVRATLHDWKGFIADAGVVFVSCPKTSRATLFGTNEEIATISATGSNVFLLSKDDPRIRKVPFDVGRPTFENVKVVHEVLMDVEIRTIPSKGVMVERNQEPGQIQDDVSAPANVVEVKAKDKMETQLAIDLPLTQIHDACRDGNLTCLLDLLKTIEEGSSDINQPAGYDCMTPLHFAASSTEKVDPVTAAACVSALLIQAHANPCILDARGRPPYFLASHDKVREAFRKSRAVLGEDFCDWDGDAKVGPPLTDEDLTARKEKEAEKKRRKKARLKEKKAKENAQAKEMEERRKAEEEAKQQAEEAKRVRDGLAPKPSGSNVCDYCQKICKGKKRNQMFQRLDYKYCSSDCVNNHKRELMAAAAMARFVS
ncbi:hypothetical protein IV203_006191 [Nitzschia inconspicua]|uniref:VLRF1 domain-containing protein n=1 Tax=Nitzschia inconspicua TaxID=303405 RepID=A0A9K3KPA1_9STRA|nr:hypothetical protein IV203_006191 [Nitzschia inconspicua]